MQGSVVSLHVYGVVLVSIISTAYHVHGTTDEYDSYQTRCNYDTQHPS